MSDKISKTRDESTILRPRGMQEAMDFAAMICKSNFVPKAYQGRPGDVLAAVQMGAEVGLAPMQALQHIAVINGRPSVWGDAALALVVAHPACDGVDESVDSGVATCTVKRRGRNPVTRTFSVDDAKKAGLWGKQGPWSAYPDRMLQMRARGFALRDSFPDALKGLCTAEEAQDIEVEASVAPEPAKAPASPEQRTRQAEPDPDWVMPAGKHKGRVLRDISSQDVIEAIAKTEAALGKKIAPAQRTSFESVLARLQAEMERRMDLEAVRHATDQEIVDENGDTVNLSTGEVISEHDPSWVSGDESVAEKESSAQDE